MHRFPWQILYEEIFFHSKLNDSKWNCGNRINIIPIVVSWVSDDTNWFEIILTSTSLSRLLLPTGNLCFALASTEIENRVMWDGNDVSRLPKSVQSDRSRHSNSFDLRTTLLSQTLSPDRHLSTPSFSSLSQSISGRRMKYESIQRWLTLKRNKESISRLVLLSIFPHSHAWRT